MQAIRLRQDPEPADDEAFLRSFVGGLPKLPPHLEWPAKVVESRYRHLSFLAQIDLAEVPRRAGSPLPESGTLYFFVDLTGEWLEDRDGRVLFYDQSADLCEERDPPLIIEPGTRHAIHFDEQPVPEHRATHVLLLRLDSDVFLQFWPDANPCGVIQFWISPEDLAARRFDAVTVSFDSD